MEIPVIKQMVGLSPINVENMIKNTNGNKRSYNVDYNEIGNNSLLIKSINGEHEAQYILAKNLIDVSNKCISDNLRNGMILNSQILLIISYCNGKYKPALNELKFILTSYQVNSLPKHINNINELSKFIENEYPHDLNF